ncbi:D-inositol-3-phosphate glycosyltransferase [Pseudoalteromonas holothuriae]|uniref:D-inositol-3-phosphate glycosyltransferase n=1 Tax=Pseudoalteromonas holothuriae TaxID=2963714 RepID=A0A9W4R0X2_9GAMM|nr:MULTISPECIES: glycosyltransferase [unclassified Pseudoalteromonas]CAH9061867.1 D-inositol-3-phosphate glycosyltransferase [Pseudoalteromonas sp. CIP111951]CAH9062162.1 D-inositol-3-phosphate glycosyltransferase [Pseudoalteromonas sp. CIP111854]
MKHIAILVPSFPIASETFVITEINALVSAGHKVTVLAFTTHRFTSNLSANVEVFNIPKPTISDFSVASLMSSQFFKAVKTSFKFKSISTISLLGYGSSLAKLLNKLNIEHLHCHFMHGPLAYGIIAAQLAGITVSSIGHGHDVYVNGADIEHKLNECNFVVAVCKDMKSQFEGMSHTQTKLLHCGVNLNLFCHRVHAINSDVKLIFIGRLVEKKGLQFLFPAIKRLQKHYYISLDIVGDGPMYKALEDLSYELGINRQIKFIGRKSPQWIAQNCKHYTALVAPFCVASNGDKDTGPLVLKEAMACGIPVLSTRLMGVKEIVVNKVGMLCEPGDEDELVTMLRAFCELNPYVRYAMGLNAYKLVSRYFNAKLQAKKLSNWVQML